jgi:6-phosphogluconolactonase
MCLLNIEGDPRDVINPAFSRFHPHLNVVYTCTEDIENNGQIFAYAIGPDGELTKIGQVDAGGTSTCYITISKDCRHLLTVNYWDSTLAVFPISPETGKFTGPKTSMYDPKEGQAVVAAAKKNGGVNHSNNDESTIQMRQKDPHSHALVLDPYFGVMAYVPCLGKDLIREFYFDKERGDISSELNVLPSGLCTGKPDGPRYFEFHPSFDIAYVVNELSSTVAIFRVDRALLCEIALAHKAGESMDRFKGRSTLTLIQSISTIPKAFPTKMNTCGRICVHKSGRFVIVSNRGHESIAIFRVKTKGANRGELSTVGYYHTRGETPRHYQFDSSGQYLIVANQDSDSIAVFNFNLCSGEIKFTGNDYRVPSPNFVQCCPIYGDDEHQTTSILLNATSMEREPILEEKLVPSEIVTDSDAETFKSTIPANQSPKIGRKELEMELEAARREIDELKKQMSTMATYSRLATCT